VTLEFVDTNVVVYAYDRGAGPKQTAANQLLNRLVLEKTAAVSIQILTEFYSVAIRKLGLSSESAEAILADFESVTLHRPDHADLIRASQLHRRYKISWWDALMVNSALELGCSRLWTEDLRHGQRIGALTVRNPFR
jgi:predicted nucleic acid-binding protein